MSKVIIEKGTLLEKTTSDENGKIAFVKDYPFAKYVASLSGRIQSQIECCTGRIHRSRKKR